MNAIQEGNVYVNFFREQDIKILDEILASPCMVDYFCCLPATITALFVNQLYPNTK